LIATQENARRRLAALDLSPTDRELLAAFVAHGYPSVADFAVLIGEDAKILSNRLGRVRVRLGLANLTQLAANLALWTGHGVHTTGRDRGER